MYPGIDLVYYGNQSQLEYDFVVAPGADPSRIRMQLSGAAHIRADASGDLVLGVPVGGAPVQDGGQPRRVLESLLMVLVRVIIFLLGAFVVILTVRSAISTFVIPRGETVYLTRLVFLTVRFFYRLGTDRAQSYGARDRIMASYAAVSLLTLPPVWLTIITAGYAGMFWALSAPSWTEAFRQSGSSILTLGFANADRVPVTILMFSEALIGLGLVALLIAYLPTMYAGFSRRESAVSLLEVRAGSPPSAPATRSPT